MGSPPDTGTPGRTAPEPGLPPVKPPVVVFVVAVVVLALALFFTVSLLANFGTATLRPRAFLFPVLLWAVGIAAVALGIWRLGARRRYLAAMPPRERAALGAVSAGESGPLPRNPAIGFVWAAAWLAVAVLGGVVLFTDGANIVSGNVSGQRTQGLLLFTPVIGLVLGVLIAIRAVKAVGPWSAYLAGTTGRERRERSAAQLRGEVWVGPLVVSIIAGVIWLAGVVAVAIFLPHLASNTAGLFVALMLLALLAMGWIPLLWMALRRRAVNRTGLLIDEH